MKRIPIKVARELAKKYGQRVVCLVTWEAAGGRTHVVTYGESQQECEWAADLGNQIKAKVLKWPESECHAKPAKKKEESS